MDGYIYIERDCLSPQPHPGALCCGPLCQIEVYSGDPPFRGRPPQQLAEPYPPLSYYVLLLVAAPFFSSLRGRPPQQLAEPYPPPLPVL